MSQAESQVKMPIVKQIQLNPGQDVRVKIATKNVPRGLFQYTLLALPLHGTLYYDGTKIEQAGMSIDDPGKVFVDPEDGNVTVLIKYTTTDNAGIVSAVKTIIMPFIGLEISGEAYHDFDGNGIVDGKTVSQLDGDALYVTLIDHDENILASKALNKKGTFTFDNSDGLQPYNNYAVIIGTKKDLLKSFLPPKWGHSGESIDSQKKDNRKDGIAVVHVKDKDIQNIRFGLDIRPTAEDITQLAQLNPGDKVNVSVKKFKGADTENGKKIRFMITSLPNNASLYNNGKKIEKENIEIKDPSKITVDPDNGDQIVKFTYVTADKVGVVSSPATVTLPFVGLSISGQAFIDGNGDNTIEGKEISHLDDVPLYATLLDKKKNILASIALDDEGKYYFDGKDSVVPDSEYTVILSIKSQTRKQKLPQGWNPSGEGVNSKKDNKNDGSVKVSVGSKNIENVNFSFNHTPEASDILVDAQLNPGEDHKILLPGLKGEDQESAEHLRYTIRTLPKDATLYDGTRKVSKENHVLKNPSTLSIDPDNGSVNTEFTYTVTDEDNMASNVAKVTLSFKELQLSGHILNDGID